MCLKQMVEEQRVRRQIAMFFVTAALCLFFLTLLSVYMVSDMGHILE